MKKQSVLILLTALFSTLLSKAQVQPVDVAENTIKISGFGEEIFYYGFAEGDQLIFNFEEEKGKELKEIEIIELPSSSKFTDYKTKKIENKILNITRTGIYKFRFANSTMGGRICKFKIQRIPANETTKNFNSSVSWRTAYDTSTRIVQEKYLVKKEYKPITVIDPSKHYINSGSNADFKGGKSRITLPVILPKNTIEWYYAFSASRDEEMINRVKSTTNLTGQLAKFVDPSGVLNIGVNLLTSPPGADYCDIYLLDINNKTLFEGKTEYRYLIEGSRENIMSGIIKIKSTILPYLFIGIRNPDYTIGIHVAIEVVAITLQEEWGIKDVTKYDVTSRQEAYLNN